jgi:hypothetical protein
MGFMVLVEVGEVPELLVVEVGMVGTDWLLLYHINDPK